MTTHLGLSVPPVLQAAVGHGLAGSVPWPTTHLSDEYFASIVHRVVRDRLLGVFAEAVTDRAVALSPEQLERVADEHASCQSHMLSLERMLLTVADAFDAAGIEFRVLKGLALSHLVYDDPSWRVAADIDLLIRSDQFDHAVAVATTDLGGDLKVPELRPGFDREFGKESLVRLGPIELDLHRTFVTGPFGLTIDLDELFADGCELIIGGRPLRALSPQHQVLHACYNVALGDYPVRLGSVRDLLLCSKHLGVGFDDVIATARRWNGVAVVQRAAELVIETAGPGVAAEFAPLARLRVPRRQALLMRSYLTPARSYSRPLASLAVIPGFRAKLRYARAILSPSSEYLRSRGWSERRHLERAVERLRSRG